MRFTDATVVEMLQPELKRRVLADPDARASASANVVPFAVIRSFRGSVRVTLAKKQGAFAVVSVTGFILKRGHDLRKVLAVLEPKAQLRGA